MVKNRLGNGNVSEYWQRKNIFKSDSKAVPFAKTCHSVFSMRTESDRAEQSRGACRGQGCCSHLWNAGDPGFATRCLRTVERSGFRRERKERGIKLKYIGIFALRGIYFQSLIA